MGEVFSNGIRLRIRPRKVRLPDVIFLHRDHFHARHNRVWDGADLVIEVVSDSPGDRQRDCEEKLIDYAEARVAEYWIIDPERQVVIVHRLAGSNYSQPRKFGRGQIANSALLEGFGVNIGSLFRNGGEYSRMNDSARVVAQLCSPGPNPPLSTRTEINSVKER